MSYGEDLSELFPDVIKSLSTDNLELKVWLKFSHKETCLSLHDSLRSQTTRKSHFSRQHVSKRCKAPS